MMVKSVRQAVRRVLEERGTVTWSELYVRMQDVYPVDSMTLAENVNDMWVGGELVSRYNERFQQLLSLPVSEDVMRESLKEAMYG